MVWAMALSSSTTGVPDHVLNECQDGPAMSHPATMLDHARENRLPSLRCRPSSPPLSHLADLSISGVPASVFEYSIDDEQYPVRPGEICLRWEVARSACLCLRMITLLSRLCDDPDRPSR